MSPSPRPAPTRRRRFRAASAALGGSGGGARCFGFLALSAGFDRIHSQRTAAASAALMIQCTWRIDDAAIGA
jgi:hypothetical protein